MGTEYRSQVMHNADCAMHRIMTSNYSRSSPARAVLAPHLCGWHTTALPCAVITACFAQSDLLPLSHKGKPLAVAPYSKEGTRVTDNHLQNPFVTVKVLLFRQLVQVHYCLGLWC